MSKRVEISTTELADKLGVTNVAIFKKIKNKKLPKNITAKKVGFQWVFKMSQKTFDNL